MCFKCGIYGHNHENCSKNSPVEGRGDMNSPENNSGGGSEAADDNYGRESLDKENSMNRAEISDSFGPWMIVKKNIRKSYQYQGRKDGVRGDLEKQSYNGNKNKSKDTVAEGSRYVVLGETNQEENNSGIHKELHGRKRQEG